MPVDSRYSQVATSGVRCLQKDGRRELHLFLYFGLYFEIGLCCGEVFSPLCLAAQAGLELKIALIAGVTGVNHHAQPVHFTNNGNMLLTEQILVK